MKIKSSKIAPILALTVTGIVLHLLKNKKNESSLENQSKSVLKYKSTLKKPINYHYANDSGIDLYSAEDIILKNNERKLIPTGVYLDLPKGFEGQLRPKSGMSAKGIDVKLGTIDEGYTGEIKAVVKNETGKDYEFKKGDKVGQLVICKRYSPKIIRVTKIKEKDRGDNGFGSTGVR